MSRVLYFRGLQYKVAEHGVQVSLKGGCGLGLQGGCGVGQTVYKWNRARAGGFRRRHGGVVGRVLLLRQGYAIVWCALRIKTGGTWTMRSLTLTMASDGMTYHTLKQTRRLWRICYWDAFSSRDSRVTAFSKNRSGHLERLPLYCNSSLGSNSTRTKSVCARLEPG